MVSRRAGSGWSVTVKKRMGGVAATCVSDAASSRVYSARWGRGHLVHQRAADFRMAMLPARARRTIRAATSVVPSGPRRAVLELGA